MQNEKINSRQFLILVSLFTIGTSILIVPSVLASGAKQDAWLSAIIGTGIGLLVVWLYTKIALWFPNLTFIQLIEKLLGKWLGKVVSLFFVFVFLLFTAILLYHAGIFLKSHMMPYTPLPAISILVGIILIMGVRLGIETIARASEILIVVFFILFFILVVFISPDADIKNIQPIFESGIKTISQSSLLLIVVSSINAICLLMIFPSSINRPETAKKSFLMGNLIGGVVIIIITLLCILVLGPDLTARQLFPSYGLAKKINVGNFVNRIEVIMAALWIISLYFKAVLYFYAANLGLAQIMNLKNYRSITYPLGIIIIALSLIIFPNVIYNQKFELTTSISLSLTVGVFLPLVLIFVYAIRKTVLKNNF